MEAVSSHGPVCANTGNYVNSFMNAAYKNPTIQNDVVEQSEIYTRNSV
jgi:hypothetical protein